MPAEAGVGPVERHPQPVVLETGDQPAAQHRQEHHGDHAEAKLMPARGGGGLVDAQQPPGQPLDPGTQGEQGGDRTSANHQRHHHVRGVVGADRHPAQGDQQRCGGRDKAPAPRQEQTADGGGSGDGGVVGEEGAVAGAAADGVDRGQRPVRAQPEVQVAGELVEPERSGDAQAGQDDHGEAGGVAAAQRPHGQPGQQQRRPGGQDGRGQQDQQAQRLGLGGVVERPGQRPVQHDQLSHGSLRRKSVWS